jgi:hypothetical protein
MHLDPLNTKIYLCSGSKRVNFFQKSKELTVPSLEHAPPRQEFLKEVVFQLQKRSCCIRFLNQKVDDSVASPKCNRSSK